MSKIVKGIKILATQASLKLHLIKRGLPYQGAIAKGRIKKKSKKFILLQMNKREFQKIRDL